MPFIDSSVVGQLVSTLTTGEPQGREAVGAVHVGSTDGTVYAME